MNGIKSLYKTGAKNFTSKAQAYIESSKTNQPVTWWFSDDVWKTTSINLTQQDISTPLSVWYANRARQLREKYDYLILNYSGGMDSWNILHTFLKNGIFLDEIHVKSSASIDEKLVNFSLNNSSTNLMSEWYYTILPDLQWISNNYPNIKITITDAFESANVDFLNPQTFSNAGHFLGAFELMRQTTSSPTVASNSSKLIGEIWGIDKPSFHILKDGSLGVFFVDSTVNVPHTPAVGFSTQELFYYAVDMPKLPFVQAAHCYRRMKQDCAIDDIFDIDKRKLIPPEQRGHLWTQIKREVAKKYLYEECLLARPRPLQVDKPTAFSKSSRSRDYYYDIHNETDTIRSLWSKGWSEFTNQLKMPSTTPSSEIFKHHISSYYTISKELL